MLELITDRTQANVDRLNVLRAKGWENMTPAEQAEWYGEAAKGAYNYSDLNRVESAVSQIAELFGLELTTKTDWNVWDIPTESDVTRYLENVMAIRNVVPYKVGIPTVPSSLRNLNYTTANNIEKILEIAYKQAETLPRSGELYCGEV